MKHSTFTLRSCFFVIVKCSKDVPQLDVEKRRMCENCCKKILHSLRCTKKTAVSSQAVHQPILKRNTTHHLNDVTFMAGLYGMVKKRTSRGTSIISPTISTQATKQVRIVAPENTHINIHVYASYAKRDYKHRRT
jgi:hypothetical protein